MELEYQKHVLANGLSVVLHRDRSAPIVAVYVYYHVGSSREDPERSGFAHLFEHMLFQGSANVPEGDHFRLIQEAGGTLNGTTNQDRTNYFETLPSSHIELALWLESDRMGFLLPAMTQAKLDNQRDVVMNERRQSYENRPYGLVYETVLSHLYPAGHPYSWPTIGSMEHIARATLEDISSFFRTFYGPNNATLVLAGDLEPKEGLRLAERWFGGLPRGPVVDRPAPRPAGLEDSRRAVIEDDVAQPQLTLAWPTVEAWHPDEPALNLLTDVLSANRSSVLDAALTIDEPLASHVTIHHGAGELAGSLLLNLRPHEGVSLETLERRVDELLLLVASGGVPEERLEILKTRSEGVRMRALESLAARASLLGHYDCFHGDPGRLERDLARHRAVTMADVLRVAQRYVVRRPRVAVTTVPRGRRDLAGDPGGEVRVLAGTDAERSRQPAPGAFPAFAPPPVLRAPGPLPLAATPFDRLPLTRVLLAVDAGRLREGEAAGLASLSAAMLEEGTRRLDGNALTDELDRLGATWTVGTTDDETYLEVALLDRHVEAALELLTEVVLEPRFAAEDFERVRRQRRVDLATRPKKSPLVAGDVFARMVHGAGSPKGRPLEGTLASLEGLSVEDVRRFWEERALLAGTRLSVAGPRPPEEWGHLVRPFAERWAAARPGSAAPAVRLAPPPPPEGRLFAVDKPGAPQSELRVGHLGVARDDPDYFRLQALNHVLGGAFSSRINLNLREDKGFTYGARSAFGGGRTRGSFQVSTAVQTEHTAAAVGEILKELEGIRQGVTSAEVEFARSSLARTLVRSYETTSARLTFLDTVQKYGFPDDYPLERLRWLEGMQAGDLDELARRYVRSEDVVVVVVGDLERIEGELGELGLGPPERLDPTGEALAGSV